jgi:hypothetical protein
MRFHIQHITAQRNTVSEYFSTQNIIKTFIFFIYNTSILSGLTQTENTSQKYHRMPCAQTIHKIRNTAAKTNNIYKIEVLQLLPTILTTSNKKADQEWKPLNGIFTTMFRTHTIERKFFNTVCLVLTKCLVAVIQITTTGWRNQKNCGEL